MQETQVQSLGWEDPLEKGMATHSVFLPGESQWTEEPDGLQSMGSQRVGHDWVTSTLQYVLTIKMHVSFHSYVSLIGIPFCIPLYVFVYLSKCITMFMETLW